MNKALKLLEREIGLTNIKGKGGSEQTLFKTANIFCPELAYFLLSSRPKKNVRSSRVFWTYLTIIFI
jgi:hypothetical protein